MSTYSKEFIEVFVHVYSRNVACASEEDVRAFLRDYTSDMGWEQLRESHEYSSNIFDALCMFEAGMAFKEGEQEEVVE
jgi:hypothetical protein